MTINERARDVLRQVVNLHYHTCEPVGSALIHRTKAIPFSPATIRNTMMQLERGGYLCQPHTSAGRLPTDLGYRTYVNDMIINSMPATSDEKRDLDTILANAVPGPAVLEEVADYIRKSTNLITFHFPFKNTGMPLKHLHFERISPEKLLVLWVSTGGTVSQAKLDLAGDQFDGPIREKTEAYFNQVFQGRSLDDIQRELLRNSQKSDWDYLLTKVSLISRLLSRQAAELDSLRFDGISSVMDMPEFRDGKRLRGLLEITEKQTRIRRLVRRALEQEPGWIVYYIGEEMKDPDLEAFTMVLAKFSHEGRGLGCVGVLGPKRMPYLKSLQMLSHVHQRLAACA